MVKTVSGRLYSAAETRAYARARAGRAFPEDLPHTCTYARPERPCTCMWCPAPQTGVQLQAITSTPAEPHQYLPRSRAETGYVGLTPTKNTSVKPSPRQEQVALPYRVRRGLGSGEVRVQCARGTPHVDSDTRPPASSVQRSEGSCSDLDLAGRPRRVNRRRPAAFHSMRASRRPAG